MSLNELAKEITLREGKKVSVSIAQVKEVLRILAEVLIETETLFWPQPKVSAKKKMKKKKT